MAANIEQLRRTIPKNSKARFYVANTGNCTNMPLGFQQGSRRFCSNHYEVSKIPFAKTYTQKTQNGTCKLLTIIFQQSQEIMLYQV